MTRPSFCRTARPSFTRAAGADAPPLFRGRALRRRQAMLTSARELLACLPQQPGESLHGMLLARTDLAVVLVAILGHYGTACHSLRLATLAFNGRNVVELAHLLTTGSVGSLTLLCSKFFRAHNPELYAEAKEQAAGFAGRWRLAAARNHAKLATLDLGDRKLAVESSANLRSNGNAEQIAVTMDAGLHDFYAGWIDRQVADHEHAEEETDPRERRRDRQAD